VKQVIILRGLPGSGKTSLVSKIEKEYNLPATICSADDYFYFEKEHVAENYKFNKNLLSQAHAYCKNKFLEALKLKDKLIIVDNTNIKLRDFSWYVKQADSFEYSVLICSICGGTTEEHLSSNVHNVPLETIERMASGFIETPEKINNIVVDRLKYDFNEIRK